MIARPLANLLNVKKISLEEAEKFGIEKCVKLIDEEFETTISKMKVRKFENEFREWIAKYEINILK
jgi:hypothetical protein